MSDWGWMGEPMAGWGWGMAAGMALWMLIGLALLVFLVAAALRLIRPTEFRASEPSRSDALAILEERYARGEIEHEDYEQRRARIEKRR